MLYDRLILDYFQALMLNKRLKVSLPKHLMIRMFRIVSQEEEVYQKQLVLQLKGLLNRGEALPIRDSEAVLNNPLLKSSLRTLLFSSDLPSSQGLACILDFVSKTELKDTTGWPPLLSAVCSNFFELSQRMISLNPAGVNVSNQFRLTPLMSAAGNGDQKIVRLLLSTPGIQVNLQNVYGWTALMFAAAKGELQVVSELLSKPEIQIELVNSVQKTATQIALDENKTQAGELIQRFQDERNRKDLGMIN